MPCQDMGYEFAMYVRMKQSAHHKDFVQEIQKARQSLTMFPILYTELDGL